MNQEASKREGAVVPAQVPSVAAAADYRLGPFFSHERYLLRYGSALAILGLASAARFALVPLMGKQAPLLPFLVVVLIAALLCGVGPAVAVCILAPVLATWLFTAWPNGVHHIEWSGHVGLFVTAGVGTTLIVHALQKAYKSQQEALQTARALRLQAVRDLAERRKAEEALSESELRLRLMTDHLPALVSYVDREGYYRFANAAYLNWFRLEPPAPVGQHIREILGEQNYRQRISNIVRVLRGEVVSFEDLIPHCVLGPRDCEIVYVPHFGADGAVAGFYVMVHDITELKRAERAVREQEQMLKLIYDHSSDCLYLAAVEPDDRFRFVSVNETFLKVSGYSREQAVNHLMEDVFPAVNHELIRSKYREVIASKEPLVYYETAELPAGTRYGEVTLIPILSAAGEVTHIQGAVKDVTARKKAEDALREADRRKDEFLAMLAHELRNPLAPIRNVGYLLADEKLDAATVRYASQMLQRQVNQLTRLVDDLLDVARITRGLIELKKEPLPVATVLDAAIESVNALISVKHQVLNCTYARELLRVEGDGLRLMQVFENLLLNAAKYSPDRAVIDLSAAAEAGWVVVRVRDEGEGIDAQVLPHIFDLFVQADRSLDRTQGGLGVGLTIVKSLVEMHGGTVEAHSAGLGQGSEFVVRLPLLQSLDTHESGPAHPDASLASARRILIVEDNVDAAESLAMLLQAAGHETRIAHEGASALRILESFPAEFVLLDIGLPGMDGYVVAQAIRERFPHVPRRIYALTGYGRDEDRQLARTAGFDDHFVKPVDPDHLLAVIGGERPSGLSSASTAHS